MNTSLCSKVVKLIMANDTEASGTVIVPLKLLHKAKNGSEIKLSFGLKEMNVKLLLEQDTDCITLSKDIFESFGLYENMETCVKFENDVLKFGPVVGILMNEGAVGCLRKGTPTVKMLETAKAASESKVALYFFSVDDVSLEENSVKAVFYKPGSYSWEINTLPLPDVLYDRGGGFKPKSFVKARNLRKQLNNIPELLKVNSQHYFDKWNVHCKLSKYEEMNIYLPETILFDNSVDGLEQMLNKYPEVYLKMLTGSNGRQIIRVRRQLDESSVSYEYSYFKGTIIRGITESLDELIVIANEFMNNESFIIQQGIDVLTYKNNKVDLRVLMQRDGNGEWRVTSMPVRIAVGDCPVTSTKSGSRVYQFDDAFNNIFKYDQCNSENIKSDIKALSFTALNTLEIEYGIFGEIGIDVAIDKNQRLWFIESNAKPAKDTILIAGPRDDIENSFRRPFEYCRYLAGFNNVYGDDRTESTEEIIVIEKIAEMEAIIEIEETEEE